MKNFTDRQRLWFYRGLTLAATALIVHLAAVWVAPRLIIQVLMYSKASKAMNMLNQAAFPPAVTAASRDVVMPSPDMLYSVCVFDLTKGPVRISASPGLKTYWSIALYAANSDNFFVINDRTAAGKPVDIWLAPENGATQAKGIPPGSQVVVAPSVEGFLLMRVLTGNYDAEKNIVEPARRTLKCTPA